MSEPKTKKPRAKKAVVEQRKYELLPDDTVTTWDGRKLFRMRALIAIAAHCVSIGDLGGYVETEANCAQVYGDAWVSGNAWVYGDARVYGDAWVSGNAQVSGDAEVYGDARVKTVNVVATRTDGYTFLIAPTPDGPRIIAGCRYFTIEQAEVHWRDTRGGTPLGDESLSIVAHLKRMAEINGFMEPVTDEAPQP